MIRGSPASVLRSIAHRLNCAYGDIEKVLNDEMGGPSIKFLPDAEKRLDAVRRKLMTPEGECVVDQASRVGRLPKTPNGAI